MEIRLETPCDFGRRAAWVAFFAVLLLFGLAVAAAAYEIGHTAATPVDPSRGNRSVPLEIFYPADAAGEDVPVAAGPGGGFPAIAFGHGYLMSWDLYGFVWQSLVPEGYVVVLPNTEGGLFPDHEDLGLDLAFAIAWLRAEGLDPGSMFHGRVAPTAAVMGHSMGGGASLLAAASDPTITAVANFAAAETNPSAIAAAGQVSALALLFSGGNDCVTPPENHQIPMYDALASACKARITLDGASHCQFADYSWACSLGEGSCPPATLTRSEQQELTMTLLLPWLSYSLVKDPSGWDTFASLLNMTPGISSELSCDAVGIREGSLAELPGAGRLVVLPCFPNPTRDRAHVRVFLSRPARTTFRVHALSGRLVQPAESRELTAGWHTLTWDGITAGGRPAAAGVYWLRIEAAGRVQSQRLIITR